MTKLPEIISLPTAARLAGIEYRTLHSWVQRGLLSPAQEAGGSGRAALLTRDDLEAVLILRDLREIGVRPDVCQRILDAYRATGQPIHRLGNGAQLHLNPAALHTRAANLMNRRAGPSL